MVKDQESDGKSDEDSSNSERSNLDNDGKKGGKIPYTEREKK